MHGVSGILDGSSGLFPVGNELRGQAGRLLKGVVVIFEVPTKSCSLQDGLYITSLALEARSVDTGRGNKRGRGGVVGISCSIGLE